ncbi:MAG: GMC family oxidoreductase, partial [Planctomycetota bacterium]
MRRLGRYDVVVVGSGFGGAVSALRLAEKGYRVLVLEKGRRFRPAELPRSTWQIPRFFWLPELGFRGPFHMRFLRHLTVVCGVGFGGGSLVYGATLPRPKPAFFEHGSWVGLRPWREQLAPHYATAERMLGVTTNRHLGPADRVLERVAHRLGRAHDFGPTRVGIYQGPAGERHPDPYFGGEGPERTGCIRCGGCFLGCPHGAKNSLDANYLWFAERRGARMLTDTEVRVLRPDPRGGWQLEARRRLGPVRAETVAVRADRVVLAGGVLGTTELLLRMRADRSALPALSPQLGRQVRTNSEALIAITSTRPELDLSDGIAIGSELRTGEASHAEPCRYPHGSGLFRLLAAPHAPGETLGARLRELARRLLARPAAYLRAATVADFTRSSVILLYMEASEG